MGVGGHMRESLPGCRVGACVFEGGDLPLAETETPRTCELCCEGENRANTILGFRGRAWERGSPGKEGGDGSRWQRVVMVDAAIPSSLQPISTIPLLRLPTTRGD